MAKALGTLSRRRTLQLSAGAVGGALLGAGSTRWTSAAQGDAGVISLWDSWADAGSSGAVDKMIELFLANHPGVEVQREVYESMQMRDLVRTALGANTGPDLICYDTNPVTLWILVDANELAPLDEAFQRFGWDETIFPNFQQWVTVDGSRYAVPHGFEFEPVFYNKTIYDELGLSVPTTHEEFISNCEAVKEAGYIPITLGNAGSGELRHVFGFPLNNLLGEEGMANLLLCGESWDRPEVHEAIKIITVDYRDMGFYPEHANGIQSQDAMNLFLSGQAAHRLLGSWIIVDIADAGMADQIDLFLYPSIDGSEVLPQTWFGSGFEIPADSENKELAVELLHSFLSPEALKLWMEEANQVPCVPFDATDMNLNPLMKKALGMLQDAEQPKGWILPSIVPPDFYDVMNVGFQQILAGEKTVEQQVADLQAAWQKDIDSGAYPLLCE
jgi:ABC-type glycerol-3-phosphate transport system substrate-binding protein